MKNKDNTSGADDTGSDNNSSRLDLLGDDSAKIDNVLSNRHYPKDDYLSGFDTVVDLVDDIIVYLCEHLSAFSELAISYNLGITDKYNGIGPSKVLKEMSFNVLHILRSLSFDMSKDTFVFATTNDYELKENLFKIDKPENIPSSTKSMDDSGNVIYDSFFSLKFSNIDELNNSCDLEFSFITKDDFELSQDPTLPNYSCSLNSLLAYWGDSSILTFRKKVPSVISANVSDHEKLLLMNLLNTENIYIFLGIITRNDSDNFKLKNGLYSVEQLDISKIGIKDSVPGIDFFIKNEHKDRIQNFLELLMRITDPIALGLNLGFGDFVLSENKNLVLTDRDEFKMFLSSLSNEQKRSIKEESRVVRSLLEISSLINKNNYTIDDLKTLKDELSNYKPGDFGLKSFSFNTEKRICEFIGDYDPGIPDGFNKTVLEFLGEDNYNKAISDGFIIDKKYNLNFNIIFDDSSEIGVIFSQITDAKYIGYNSMMKENRN